MADMRIKAAGSDSFYASSGDDGSLTPEYELRFNARGIVPLKSTATVSGITTYAVPSDWPITVIDDLNAREFVVREKYSDMIYVFHDFNVGKTTLPSGHLKEITTRQWRDASPRITGYQFSHASDGRLLQIIPPAPQDNLRILYKYAGVLTDKISSVQVWNGSESTGTLLMRADYLYWDDVTDPASDLGTTGCLVQVKVSKKSSNDTGNNLSIKRYTQYRYATDPSIYTYLYDDQGVLRSVYENEAIQQMVADSADAATPEELLNLPETGGTLELLPYASRWFEYYAGHDLGNLPDDTSAVDTPWETGENLESKYGGAGYPEAHEIRVKAEHIGRGAGCTSCSVGASVSITRQYHYMHVWPNGYEESPRFQWWIWHNHTAPRDINETRMLVVEDTLAHDDPDNFPNGRPLYRKIYALNDFGRKLREVLIEDPRDDGTLKAWCWAWTFVKADINGDGQFTHSSDLPNLKHRLAEYRLPSAYNVVSNDDLKNYLNPYHRDRSDNSESWANDEAVLRSSDGFIAVYEYNSLGLRTGERVKKGRTGTAYYVSAMDWGDGSNDKPTDRIVATYTYPVATTTLTDGSRIQTKYEYTFWDSQDTRIKSRVTKVPEVVSTQNGPGAGSSDPDNAVVVAKEEYYDNKGRLRWTKDGEGYVTYYSYHPDKGTLAYTAVDVPNSYSPTVDNAKWVPASDGSANSIQPTRGSGLPTPLALVTTGEFDSQGRLVLTNDSSGAKHYTAYQQDTTNNVERTIQLRYWDASNSRPRLPMEVSDVDDQGRLKATYTLPPTYTLSISGGIPVGLASAPSVSNYITLIQFGYDNITGRLTHIDSYHKLPTSLPGDLSTNFNRTAYVYGSEGRRAAVVQTVDGSNVTSATVQVAFQEYDVLGRPTVQKAWRATGFNVDPSSGTTSLALAALKTTASTKPVLATAEYDGGGIGDSHVSSTKQFYGTNASSDYVETIYKRTYRGHIRGFDHKNGTTGFGPYRVQDVDWLGRVIASATYASAPSTWPMDYSNYVHDPSANSGAGGPTGSGYNDTLIAKFDDLGRVYQRLRFPGTQSANHFEMNNYYDRNGQQVAFGEKNSTQTEYAYDGAGRLYQNRTVLDLEPTKYTSGKFNYRDPLPDPHWKAGTSGLDTSAVQSGRMTGGDDGVIDITHTVHNQAGNVTQQHMFEANHNDSDGLDLTSNDDYVRRSTYRWYDAADQPSATADYGSGDTASGAGAWKYTAVPGMPSSAPTASSDAKLVTLYGYNSPSGRLETVTDPAGKVIKTFYDDLGRRSYVAENYDNFNPPTTNIGDPSDSSKDRVTTWAYNGMGKVTTLTTYNGSSSSVEVTKYLYLDNYNVSLVTNTIYPDSTDTDNSGTDQVKLEYNLDGTLKKKTDQRGVELTYAYDVARRAQAEVATSFGSSGAVDDTVKSVTRSYDGMGRPEKFTSHGNATSDPANTSDIKNQILYTVGSEGLVTKTEQSHSGAVGMSTPATQYAFDNGVSSNVFNNGLRANVVTYPNGRVIYQDYGTADATFDRLNRVYRFRDTNSSGTILTEYAYNGRGRLAKSEYSGIYIKLQYYGATAGIYDRLDRFGRVLTQSWAGNDTIQYTYDYAGNRLVRDAPMRDQAYTYDGLQRLKTVDQGTLSSGSITSKTFAQQWTLDQLGNWPTFKQDDDGNGTWDLNQSRTHSAANELSEIDSSNSHVAEDNAGNMTKLPKPTSWSSHFDLKYDAWNRLVEVKDGSNVVQHNDYDGLGHRIVRAIYSSGSLSYKVHYFYNENWQLLEERKETGGTMTSNPLNQYLWHPYYIDAVAVHWWDSNADGDFADPNEVQYYGHDANYNVTTIFNGLSQAIERYFYTPYGGLTVMAGIQTADFNGDGNVDGGDYISWQIHHGATSGATQAIGDADGDHDVDSTDYDIWRSQFGNSATYQQTSAIGNTHFFTGRELDADTGLQLNRWRFYNAQLGRWTRRDPYEYFANQMNLYEYVGSNPLTQTDAYGLAPCPAGQVLMPACCTYCYACNRTILTATCGYIFGLGKQKQGCDPPKLYSYCATVGPGGPVQTPNKVCSQHNPGMGWYCSYWVSAAGTSCSPWNNQCDKDLAKWLKEAGEQPGKGTIGYADCVAWCSNCVAPVGGGGKGNPITGIIAKICIEQICDNSF